MGHLKAVSGPVVSGALVRCKRKGRYSWQQVAIAQRDQQGAWLLQLAGPDLDGVRVVPAIYVAPDGVNRDKAGAEAELAELAARWHTLATTRGQVARVWWQLKGTAGLLAQILAKEGPAPDGSIPISRRALEALLATLRDPRGLAAQLELLDQLCMPPEPAAAAAVAAEPPAPLPAVLRQVPVAGGWSCTGDQAGLPLVSLSTPPDVPAMAEEPLTAPSPQLAEPGGAHPPAMPAIVPAQPFPQWPPHPPAGPAPTAAAAAVAAYPIGAPCPPEPTAYTHEPQCPSHTHLLPGPLLSASLVGHRADWQHGSFWHHAAPAMPAALPPSLPPGFGWQQPQRAPLFALPWTQDAPHTRQSRWDGGAPEGAGAWEPSRQHSVEPSRPYWTQDAPRTCQSRWDRDTPEGAGAWEPSRQHSVEAGRQHGMEVGASSSTPLRTLVDDLCPAQPQRLSGPCRAACEEQPKPGSVPETGAAGTAARPWPSAAAEVAVAATAAAAAPTVAAPGDSHRRPLLDKPSGPGGSSGAPATVMYHPAPAPAMSGSDTALAAPLDAATAAGLAAAAAAAAADTEPCHLDTPVQQNQRGGPRCRAAPEASSPSATPLAIPVGPPPGRMGAALAALAAGVAPAGAGSGEAAAVGGTAGVAAAVAVMAGGLATVFVRRTVGDEPVVGSTVGGAAAAPLSEGVAAALPAGTAAGVPVPGAAGALAPGMAEGLPGVTAGALPGGMAEALDGRHLDNGGGALPGGAAEALQGNHPQ
ncbi:hypothetical protein N2152v2_007393 [Parachlorella kessleri]